MNLYKTKEQERKIRNDRRKELGIFQEKKTMTIVIQIPQREISLSNLNIISPLSIQTDLEAKYQL